MESQALLRSSLTTTVSEKQSFHIRGNVLLKNVIEGRTDGKRPRGRTRIGMPIDLKEDCCIHKNDLSRDRTPERDLSGLKMLLSKLKE